MAIAALRFNNPGNVSLPIQGYKGPGQIVGISGQPGYAAFPTMADGLAAQRQRLANYIDVKGLTTIGDLNTKYAEDPNWKNNVAKFSGLGVNQPINTSDPAQMDRLQAGIIRQETGKDPSVFGFSPGGSGATSTGDGLGYGNGGGGVETSVGTQIQSESYTADSGTVVFGNGPENTGVAAAGTAGIDGSSFSSANVSSDAQNGSFGLGGIMSGGQVVGGGNVTGYNAAGPVQGSPGLVSATEKVAANTKEGDKQITDGVKTAGQTIGQAITSQSQSWITWASDSLLRVFVLVIGLALFAGALYYFGKPAIDQAVKKMPKVVPIPV